MRASLFIAILLVAVGCCPTKSITVDERQEVRTVDSLVVREMITFDTIRIPKMEADLSVPLSDLIPGYTNSNQENRPSLTLSVDTLGILQARCVCDSIEEYVRSLEREVFLLRAFSRKTTTDTTRTVKPWYLNSYWIASGLIALFWIVFFIYRLIKKASWLRIK